MSLHKLLKSSLFVIISPWNETISHLWCLPVHTHRKSVSRDISQEQTISILLCNHRHRKTLFSRIWEVSHVMFRHKPWSDLWFLVDKLYECSSLYSKQGGGWWVAMLGVGRECDWASQCLMLWFNVSGREAFCHCCLSRVPTLTPDSLTFWISVCCLANWKPVMGFTDQEKWRWSWVSELCSEFFLSDFCPWRPSVNRLPGSCANKGDLPQTCS